MMFIEITLTREKAAVNVTFYVQWNSFHCHGQSRLELLVASGRSADESLAFSTYIGHFVKLTYSPPPPPPHPTDRGPSYI